MATRDEGEGLPIGEVLKRTRTRLKLDIRTVEEQTKIRTKYLRALENEEWETLPGPTYVKGFLRTYASYLGLDADALVDEYRRTVEGTSVAEQPYLFKEPLLELRRRPGEPERRSPGFGVIIGAGIGVLAVAVIAVIALTGGSSNERKHHHKGKHQHSHHAHSGKSQQHGGGGSSNAPVTLSLVTHDDVVLCLLPGHGRPLIDSQTLVSGSKEGPFEPAAENYRLDLDSGGKVTVTLAGKPHPVESKKPASFAIDANGIKPISFKGPNCP
jgi:cytoskeleton protein RodZ